MTDLLKDSELDKYGLTPEVLLVKFNAQLLKDFEMSGVQEYLKTYSGGNYEHIQLQLAQILRNIIANNNHSLNNLIYRIDITEKQVSEKLNSEQKRSYENVLAELIIKRVLQKVILKQIYSK